MGFAATRRARSGRSRTWCTRCGRIAAAARGSAPPRRQSRGARRSLHHDDYPARVARHGDALSAGVMKLRSGSYGSRHARAYSARARRSGERTPSVRGRASSNSAFRLEGAPSPSSCPASATMVRARSPRSRRTAGAASRGTPTTCWGGVHAAGRHRGFARVRAVRFRLSSGRS